MFKNFSLGVLASLIFIIFISGFSIHDALALKIPLIGKKETQEEKDSKKAEKEAQKNIADLLKIEKKLKEAISMMRVEQNEEKELQALIVKRKRWLRKPSTNELGKVALEKSKEHWGALKKALEAHKDLENKSSSYFKGAEDIFSSDKYYVDRPNAKKSRFKRTPKPVIHDAAAVNKQVPELLKKGQEFLGELKESTQKVYDALEKVTDELKNKGSMKEGRLAKFLRKLKATFKTALVLLRRNKQNTQTEKIILPAGPSLYWPENHELLSSREKKPVRTTPREFFAGTVIIFVIQKTDDAWEILLKKESKSLFHATFISSFASEKGEFEQPSGEQDNSRFLEALGEEKLSQEEANGLFQHAKKKTWKTQTLRGSIDKESVRYTLYVVVDGKLKNKLMSATDYSVEEVNLLDFLQRVSKETELSSDDPYIELDAFFNQKNFKDNFINLLKDSGVSEAYLKKSRVDADNPQKEK